MVSKKAKKKASEFVTWGELDKYMSEAGLGLGGFFAQKLHELKQELLRKQPASMASEKKVDVAMEMLRVLASREDVPAERLYALVDEIRRILGVKE